MFILDEMVALTAQIDTADVLTVIRDSLAEVSKHTVPYQIQGYSPDLISIWVALLALVFSIVSAVYAVLQYKSQDKTKENTHKSNEHSFNMSSVVRGHYRCMVYPLAIDFMYDKEHKRGKKSKIASRVYLDKLKSPADIIPVASFHNEDAAQLPLNNLKTHLYLYALEAENAANNLHDRANGTLSKEHFETLWETDFSNLCYKPIYLMRLIMEASDKLRTNKIIKENHTTKEDVAGLLLEKFHEMVRRQFILNVGSENEVELIKDKLQSLSDLRMNEIQRSINELVDAEGVPAQLDSMYNVSLLQWISNTEIPADVREKTKDVYNKILSLLSEKDAILFVKLLDGSRCNIWKVLPVLLKIEVAVELQFKMKNFIER